MYSGCNENYNRNLRRGWVMLSIIHGIGKKKCIFPKKDEIKKKSGAVPASHNFHLPLKI